jgi:outer membrane protein assembly factor BamA
VTRVFVSLLIVLSCAVARAQVPAPPAVDPPADDALAPTRIDLGTCATLDLTPGALLQTVPDELALAQPIPWSEFAVEGKLVDTQETVRKLLEPTLQQYRTSLSLATLPELALTIAKFGYQLVGHHTVDIPNGQRLVLHLAPLPLVRRVDVEVDQGWFDKLLEDEVGRRTSIRVGTYLPWEPIRRQCLQLEEEHRIRQLLADEGYFDAEVKVVPAMHVGSAEVRIKVDLGPAYTLGKVTINCPSGSERRKERCVDSSTNAPIVYPLTDDQIRAAFKLEERCLIAGFICYGTPRFTREAFQEHVAKLKKRFQDNGYPSVRVVASDPADGVQHKNKTVNIAVTIDLRRKIDVEFQGYKRDVVSDEQLRKHLTFNLAGSADELEIGESAQALTTYLQTRGFFDAHVTWIRERVDTEPRPNTNDAGLHLDKIMFKIAMGDRRRVVKVEFVGAKAISDATLRDLIATKESNLSGRLLGTILSATSAELIGDQERIKEAYRRIGYVDARVVPSASPQAAGLDNPALTAALLGLEIGGDLYVRFTIDEGEPTLLSRVVLTGEDGKPVEPLLCGELLVELGRELDTPEIGVRAAGDECAATIRKLNYRADELANTRDTLREFLYRTGRGRAVVQLEPAQIGPLRMQAHYTVGHTEPLKLGKVVIRGNFKTINPLIYHVLDFDEGQPLTTDSLALGARRLRNTGLFEAVSIEMPELDCDDVQRTCNSDVINAVVRVEERYDNKVEINVEGGYSSENGGFGTVGVAQYNLLGTGIAVSGAVTQGQKLNEYEARLKLPEWLPDKYFPLSPKFTTELIGRSRQQDTERFGRLLTQSITAEFSSKLDERPRTEAHPARVITIGPSYAFRKTSRNIDALRPIGADQDESQVAVSRRTGQVGIRFNIEERVDRTGQFAPLAPEDGYRFETSASYASPIFYGQDTFLKFSASISKFIPVGSNVVLRGDLRYDHGIPLGGAVLLPDVERFFAGGDSTVRGYSNERLATELVQVSVPPFDNVTQIRSIPAGGNIRVLSSVDGQVRIWKVFAAALFSDAGLITNQWSTVDVKRKWGFVPDIPQLRPSVGMGLRVLTPFGILALEYAVPLSVQLGDDPRGKLHFYFAARAQF